MQLVFDSMPKSLRDIWAIRDSSGNLKTGDPIHHCCHFKKSLGELFQEVVLTKDSLNNQPFVHLPQVVCVALPGTELPTELPTKSFLVPGKDHEVKAGQEGTQMLPLRLREEIDKDPCQIDTKKFTLEQLQVAHTPVAHGVQQNNDHFFSHVMTDG